MSRAFVTKTSFTAGELDPLLLGPARPQGAGGRRRASCATSWSTRPAASAAGPACDWSATVPGALRLLAFDGADGGEIAGIRPVPARRDQARRGRPLDHRTRCGVRPRSPISAPRAGATGCCSAIRRAAQGAGPQRRRRAGQLQRLAVRDRRSTTLGLPRERCGRSRSFARPEIALQIHGGTDADDRRRQPSSRSSPASRCSRPTASAR